MRAVRRSKLARRSGREKFIRKRPRKLEGYFSTWYGFHGRANVTLRMFPLRLQQRQPVVEYYLILFFSGREASRVLYVDILGWESCRGGTILAAGRRRSCSQRRCIVCRLERMLCVELPYKSMREDQTVARRYSSCIRVDDARVPTTLWDTLSRGGTPQRPCNAGVTGPWHAVPLHRPIFTDVFAHIKWIHTNDQPVTEPRSDQKI